MVAGAVWRLLIDVNEALGGSGGDDPRIDSQVRALVIALHHEFAREEATFAGANNKSAEVESLYARALSASGTVLDDGYHFGQTYASTTVGLSAAARTSSPVVPQARRTAACSFM